MKESIPASEREARKSNNDSGNPTRECNVIKSKLKMRVDKMNCNNQLLGATKYEISTENSTVENAHIVEISTENLTTQNENITEKVQKS